MSLLDRYVGQAVIGGTLVALLVLLGIDVFFAFGAEMDNIGDGRYGLTSALVYLLLTIPRRIYTLFPTAALIGSLVGLGTLVANHELVAFRAAGASIWRIVRAVLQAGLVMLVLVAAIGEFVMPRAEQTANFQRKLALTEQAALKGEYGFWARDGDRYINIREILPGGRLSGVFVYELGPKQELRRATKADYATYSEGRWLMERVRESAITDAGVTTRSQRRAVWGSLLNPQLLDVVVARPENLSSRDLRQYIGYLEDNGLASNRYRLAFWSKMAAPAVGLVMVFIAIPFVFGALREAGNGQRIVVGVLVGLGFYLFNRAALHMGAVYQFNPVLTAFVPPLLFFAIAALAMRRFR